MIGRRVMPGRRANLVAGGKTDINFVTLGVGRHTQNIKNAVSRRVFSEKPGCCNRDNKWKLKMTFY